MENLSFENRLQKVKEIIDGIESGRMPLEECVKQFEAGIKSLNDLEKELEDMKRKVSILMEKPDGTTEEKPLGVPHEE